MPMLTRGQKVVLDAPKDLVALDSITEADSLKRLASKARIDLINPATFEKSSLSTMLRSGSFVDKSRNKILSERKFKAMLDSSGFDGVDSLISLASNGNLLSEDAWMQKVSDMAGKASLPDRKAVTELVAAGLPEKLRSSMPPLSGNKLPLWQVPGFEGLKARAQDSLLSVWAKKREAVSAKRSKWTDSLHYLQRIAALDSVAGTVDIKGTPKHSLYPPHFLLSGARGANGEAGQAAGMPSRSETWWVMPNKSKVFRGTLEEIQDSARINKGNLAKISHQSARDSLVINATRRAETLQKVKSLEREIAQMDSLYEGLMAKEQQLKSLASENASQKKLGNKVKSRFSNQEKSADQVAQQVILKEKSRFAAPFYFEGIVSSIKDFQGEQGLHIAPGFGYEIKDGFSIGAGPTLVVSFKEKLEVASFGYRLFGKYRLPNEWAYLQVEDISMKTTRYTHTFLMGGGVLIPLGGKVFVNAGLLYRLGNSVDAAVGNRWVLRLGLSTKKLTK